MVLLQFLCSPNNYENVSHKINEFDKEKARGKVHNSGKFAKRSESSNNISVLDCVRLNNADGLTVDQLNKNSLKNKV